MKRLIIPVILLACLCSLAQQKQENAEPKVVADNPQFNALKSLSGEWQVKMPDGTVSTQTYRVVSDKSAIILDQNVPGENVNMITMFHPDGKKTVATHYCSMGNQPRMVAEASADTKVIPFKFKDITNDDGKSGSMRDLTIKLIDADHHDQEWTWQDAKGKQETVVFHFVRSNSPTQGK